MKIGEKHPSPSETLTDYTMMRKRAGQGSGSRKEQWSTDRVNDLDVSERADHRIRLRGQVTHSM